MSGIGHQIPVWTMLSMLYEDSSDCVILNEVIVWKKVWTSFLYKVKVESLKIQVGVAAKKML